MWEEQSLEFVHRHGRVKVVGGQAKGGQNHIFVTLCTESIALSQQCASQINIPFTVHLKKRKLQKEIVNYIFSLK